jgi:hypothetical protein
MDKRLPPSLPDFTAQLAKFYPVTYKKALEWAHSGDLPCWPRNSTIQERFKIRLGEPLRDFLRQKGMDDETIEQFLMCLLSP